MVLLFSSKREVKGEWDMCAAWGRSGFIYLFHHYYYIIFFSNFQMRFWNGIFNSFFNFQMRFWNESCKRFRIRIMITGEKREWTGAVRPPHFPIFTDSLPFYIIFYHFLPFSIILLCYFNSFSFIPHHFSTHFLLSSSLSPIKQKRGRLSAPFSVHRP